MLLFHVLPLSYLFPFHCSPFFCHPVCTLCHSPPLLALFVLPCPFLQISGPFFITCTFSLFFCTQVQTPVTLCSGELWSILVVRLAHSADLRSRLRHVSSAPSVAYSTGSLSKLVSHSHAHSLFLLPLIPVRWLVAQDTVLDGLVRSPLVTSSFHQQMEPLGRANM